MLINFREIPKANTGVGDQDDFELFARDFLSEIGYVVVEQPARGADGGKDLIVTKDGLRWLVSCKHFAHGKKSVGAKDEINILERVRANDCSGFFGFYSTVPGESLMKLLRALQSEISHLVYDHGKIEAQIVGYQNRENIFMRFFPASYEKWQQLKYSALPVRLFNSYLEKNYNYYVELIKQVFGKTENLIRILLDNDSLEKVFEFQNLNIVISDQAIKILFSQKPTDNPSEIDNLLKEIFYKEIPRIISRDKEIDIYNSLHEKIIVMFIAMDKISSMADRKKTTYVNSHPDKQGYFGAEVCVIYQNHIVFTEKLYEAVSKAFDELRQMLK